MRCARKSDRRDSLGRLIDVIPPVTAEREIRVTPHKKKQSKMLTSTLPADNSNTDVIRCTNQTHPRITATNSLVVHTKMMEVAFEFET